VDDPVVGLLQIEIEHPLPARLEAAHELVVAVRVLDEQQREIRREALAQPHIVPVVLGDRVAEPLVRDLVDDDVAPALAARAGDRSFAVEDRAGRFHAATLL
jgi:hypothetical protein